MRVDGPVGVQNFDNMSDRPLTGGSDWHQISVVLDIPGDAVGFAVGMLLHGRGLVLFDDATLEVVGPEVPTTVSYTPQPADSSYRAKVEGVYAAAVDVPLNLGLEIASSEPSATTDWVRQHAVKIATTDPSQPLDDLAPLTALIGNAHVVGLGEGTHGTHEFFTLKHRMVKHLVTQMGFTQFAIEATSLEADDVNRYVMGGPGNAQVLLSRLYFWTWRTREVLDLIEWMRAYNATVRASRKVSFAGIDMQFVTAPMDSVTAFIQRVDPSKAQYVAERFECMTAFRNALATPGQPASAYALRSAADRTSCATGLGEVYALLESGKTAYAAAEPSRFEGALHAARLVQQFEAMAAASGNTLSSNYARDKAMAENVQWLRQQAGPDSKLVIWAHNDHVNSTPNWMGGHLRVAYGSDYRALGFLFGDGTFNAVNFGDVRPVTVAGLPTGVLERFFTGTGDSLLLLDARQVSSGGSAALALAGPIRMRSIGSTYEGASSDLYFHTVRLPADFDLLMYVGKTTETVRLPYTP